MANAIRKISWIWLIIAIFFAQELLWSYLTPPWQAPDEIAHFGYVESLFYEHAFPVLGEAQLSARVQAIGPVETQKQIDDYRGSLSLNWIAQHPPLYYLGLEPLYALLPHDNPLFCIFVLRLISMAMGCVTLFFSYKTLKLLAPGNELLQKTVIVGMAFLPMFSSISALMNNDNLVFMLAAMLTYLSVKNFDRHDTRGSLQMGILLGLLALTKSTSLPLFLSIFILEIIKHARLTLKKNGYPKCFLKHQAAIFGVAFAIAGWWYARNLALYHTLLPNIGKYVAANPELLSVYPDIARVFPEATGTFALPDATLWDFFIRQGFLWEYYKNVWGAFGQFFFRLFTWQYVVIGGLTLASFCGYLKVFMVHGNRWFNVKNKKEMMDALLAWKGWTMFLPVLAVSAAIIYELFEIYRERGFLGALQGRYLFSALLACMYLFVRGIGHVGTKKSMPIIMKLLMTFFVLNGFVTVMFRIIPEFY